MSPVSLNSTRPALLLAPRLDAIWVFARAERGDIAVWESRFGSPAFDSGAFSSWTGAAGNFGDPTTTRQPIPPGRGAVVATAKIDAGEYWHNEFLP